MINIKKWEQAGDKEEQKDLKKSIQNGEENYNYKKGEVDEENDDNKDQQKNIKSILGFNQIMIIKFFELFCQ